MKTGSYTADLQPVAQAHHILNRNAFIFGWTPQAELWNGRLAMLGLTTYLLWNLASSNVVCDLLH
ncbi:chlorophyll a/b-binding protein [Chlorogloeopsis sp. ULAP02]|uniref:chlorophyll a/b-binding protein n=1 Tax=Chlorogloeopsis sp. ULAP02 TaxID=3107926 RepID=UPI003135B799